MEEVLLYRGFWETGIRRLWKLSISLWELCDRNQEGERERSFIADSEGSVKEGSRSAASLSVGAPWGEPGGWASLLGTRRDMSRRALEVKHVSLYRGILREGFYTENSERHGIVGSGNWAFIFVGTP